MEITKNIPFYHGSNKIVRVPDLSKSRTNIDFNTGHYLTTSEELASKWAVNKDGDSFVNIYYLNPDGLKIKEFQLDKEWLHFVSGNRTKNPKDFSLYQDYEEYDVLVGPIADDNLFTTLDLYFEGYISSTKAVKIMNCMNYGSQIVLKTQKAIDQLTFYSAKQLSPEEERKIEKLLMEDKVLKFRRSNEMLKSIRDIWED